MSWNHDYAKVPFPYKLAEVFKDAEWSVRGLCSSLVQSGYSLPENFEELSRCIVNFCSDVSTFSKLVNELTLFCECFFYTEDDEIGEPYAGPDGVFGEQAENIEELSEEYRISAALSALGTSLGEFPPSRRNTGSHKRLSTVGDLLQFLNLSLSELEFLSDYDLREHKRTDLKLQNYHYIFIPKKNGLRLLEAPKTLLKECQVRINEHILKHLAVHPAACAYVPRKSTVDFARPHCGRKLVLKLDLDNFYARIHRRQVEWVFKNAGYPYFVSRFLTGLCVNFPPRFIIEKAGDVYNSAHLPQGAPTSPALSNLCFSELDKKIAEASDKFNVTYTRYADDMVFSSKCDFKPNVFTRAISSIVAESGHRINRSKTKLMTRKLRQHVCNITVNEHINCSRKYFDELKAILYNCVRHGNESQNRQKHPNFRLHLLGRINYVRQLNARRGEKLMKLFNQVSW